MNCLYCLFICGRGDQDGPLGYARTRPFGGFGSRVWVAYQCLRIDVQSRRPLRHPLDLALRALGTTAGENRRETSNRSEARGVGARVEQALAPKDICVEREFGAKVVGSVTYLYVHGLHLLRSLDANLPPPIMVQYPVYNDNGSVFLGTFYDVASFATWQTTPSVTCPYPPCINPVQRPIPQLGTINSFQSSSSSVYNGMTVSLKRQVGQGMYFRVGYTLSKTMDDGPDALVVGRPGNVQNSYNTSAERAYSTDDQRLRFVAAWVAEPRKFELNQAWLNALVNHWKFSSIVTFGSGRRLNATIASDPNGDGNIYNDRLPTNSRNAFTGTDYFSTDLRLTRNLKIRGRAKLDLLAESFNVTNRNNKRVQISDDGFFNSAGQFVAYSTLIQANGQDTQ